MRAAVLGSAPDEVRITDVEPNPAPASGDEAMARVAAAALNPVDVAIAGGRLRFRTLPEGAVLGFEGVAEQGPGSYVYFSAPRPPWGSFAEQVQLDEAETVQIPEGVDPVEAAAVGVPGIAAYLALTRAARMAAGDRVLVLGATGSVGRIAVQVAHALGAEAVIGTARDAAGLRDVESLGAVGVSSADADVLASELATSGGDGFDVVVDTIWGESVGATLPHLRTGARFAQVGNAASPSASISAPDFRNRGAGLVGHSNFLATAAERADAYTHVVELLRQGRVRVLSRAVPLDDLPEQWSALASGTARGKTIVVPSIPGP